MFVFSNFSILGGEMEKPKEMFFVFFKLFNSRWGEIEKPEEMCFFVFFQLVNSRPGGKAKRSGFIFPTSRFLFFCHRRQLVTLLLEILSNLLRHSFGRSVFPLSIFFSLLFLYFPAML